ncbi:hypothetical protein QYF36_002789 [Acer negundo]|nr:hypothetical protein QYF36_002789 [Acer negundo]
MLLEMCILSGCDYLPSLPGMGLKRAHALISKFKSYEKVIKHLKYSTVSVPPLYEESFKKAVLTFQHQRLNIDPFTQLPFQGCSDSSELALDRKSHFKSFKPESERKKLDLPRAEESPDQIFLYPRKKALC